MTAERKNMVCKIHRMEDKLLRSKDYHEQEKIQVILRIWRKQLQQLEWDEYQQGLA